MKGCNENKEKIYVKSVGWRTPDEVSRTNQKEAIPKRVM